MVFIYELKTFPKVILHGECLSHCRQLEHAGFEVGNVCAFLDTALCRRLAIPMLSHFF